MRKIRNAATGKKATAWKNFSRYIKARDALETTGGLEYCKCITCGQVKPIAEMDAGHMIGGRRAGILFDESIVFAQCQTCNRTNGGEYQAFKREMIERNGEEWYAEKERQKTTVVHATDESYELISKLYLEKYKALTSV
jgi:NAD-dependent SIR2 family protein deacetylase